MGALPKLVHKFWEYGAGRTVREKVKKNFRKFLFSYDISVRLFSRQWLNKGMFQLNNLDRKNVINIFVINNFLLDF